MGPECRGETGRSSGLPKYGQRLRSRAFRTMAFTHGEPVIVGDMTYTKDGETWHANNGSKMSDANLRKYLCHYGFILEDHDLVDKVVADAAVSCSQDTALFEVAHERE